MVVLLIAQPLQVGFLAIKPSVNHTGWMTVVPPIDRPKLAHDRFVLVSLSYFGYELSVV